MKFLLNTVAMSLTAISIFSAPLTQAEVVPLVSFSEPSIQAHKVLSSAVSNPQAGQNAQQDTNWKNVPTQFIRAGGVNFAYREYGQQNGGTPIIFLNHLAAVLDNWDPRIIDGIAAKHHVVVFDNRGVGASTGKPAQSIEQMADDAIAFIQAKGFKQVDLFGFSMGGMIAFGEKLSALFSPGTHGSTFGGNPVVCAGANVVVDRMDQSFLANVNERAVQLRAGIAKLPHVKSISGIGLMVGIEFYDLKAADVLAACREAGLLVLTAKTRLRLLPPLTLSEHDVDMALEILSDVLGKMEPTAPKEQA